MDDFATYVQAQGQAEGGSLAAVTVTASSDGTGLTFTDNATGSGSQLSLRDGFDSATLDGDGGFGITGAQVDGSSLGANTVAAAPVDSLDDGDLVINGSSIGASTASSDTASDTKALTSDAAASGISIAAAINEATVNTGVTATVNATSLTGGAAPATVAAATSAGSIHINGVQTNAIVLSGDADMDRNAAIDAVNAVSGQTGVVAEDNGVSVTLTAADGRNISVAIDNQGTANYGAALGLDSTQAGIGEGDITNDTALTAENVAATTYSSVQLSGTGEIEVKAGSNGTAALESLEFTQGTFGSSESGTSISDIDISTLEGANQALTSIDNALQSISAERSNLGAIQNRFESTISNLSVTSENLSAANSRILDADFAAETAALSKTQVLQQAGISILSQANAAPQQVLSLLQ
jgi:flagellin